MHLFKNKKINFNSNNEKYFIKLIDSENINEIV